MYNNYFRFSVTNIPGRNKKFVITSYSKSRKTKSIDERKQQIYGNQKIGKFVRS